MKTYPLHAKLKRSVYMPADSQETVELKWRLFVHAAANYHSAGGIEKRQLPLKTSQLDVALSAVATAWKIVAAESRQGLQPRSAEE